MRRLHSLLLFAERVRETREMQERVREQELWVRRQQRRLMFMA